MTDLGSFLSANPWAVALLKIAVVIGCMLGVIAYTVLAERRICAFIQDRLGPNRVGPFGLFQPIADGMKFLFKENVLPAHVNKLYYILAPTIAMIPALLAFAVIPFGSRLHGEPMVIADLNVGVLWVFSIASLGVYGIVLAGWASNSKYPFLGGIRSSAQMISYEIAMGMSVIGVFMLVGSLNLTRVVEYQSGLWLFFKQPLGFLIFMVAAFAETNRLPFDLPESEQELVSGYHTEYGSMKFALFFLAEYANLITASALMVTLFFGGWQAPFFDLSRLSPCVAGVLHIICFAFKMLIFMLLFIWTRWMLPRFRYDQLMDLGWKVFVPLALLNILITGLVIAFQT
ncbi:MAG: NADH-quinone oxidoreductase subunit NuoH [Verrucomicrobia bacterium]|nr:NADH-quinone oxidoreductase subunit NuoH [Verrucomicrobiota bacterium]